MERYGRRFVVSKPSVATVALILDRLGPEVMTLLQTQKVRPDIFGEAAPEVCMGVLLSAHHERLAEVFASCVDGPDILKALHEDNGLADELGRAVLSLCDPARIVRELSLGDPEAPMIDATADIPSDFEVGIIRGAEVLGVSPLELMRWPFEAFLTATTVRAYLAEKDRPGPRLDPRQSANWAKPGVM